MTTNIIIVALVVIGLLIVGTGIYVYLRDKTLEEIRGEVYQLFLAAEHTYTESGSGKQKMKWVISKARGLLPGWLQVFVTEELLYKVVQGWFSAVKDLLDDGKYNNSTE